MSISTFLNRINSRKVRGATLTSQALPRSSVGTSLLLIFDEEPVMNKRMSSVSYQLKKTNDLPEEKRV
jgi:hypothetical protein